jgi:hypothetical protein
MNFIRPWQNYTNSTHQWGVEEADILNYCSTLTTKKGFA